MRVTFQSRKRLWLHFVRHMTNSELGLITVHFQPISYLCVICRSSSTKRKLSATRCLSTSPNSSESTNIWRPPRIPRCPMRKIGTLCCSSGLTSWLAGCRSWRQAFRGSRNCSSWSTVIFRQKPSVAPAPQTRPSKAGYQQLYLLAFFRHCFCSRV